MPQIIEFVGNHTLLFVAFFATLGMLLYTEFQRFQSASTALSPYAATALMNEGETLLLDVRDDAEFKSGHLLNARNFPVRKLDERLHEIEKYKERNVVIYCDNGMRTSRASSKLKKKRIRQPAYLAGRTGRMGKGQFATVTK